LSPSRRLRSSIARILGRGPGDSTAEIIATVSHEIRSPLTTIKGFTKTLIDRWERLPDDAKLDMLRAINADADRVTRLLTELLEVSRLEAGRLQVHLQRVDLTELARSVAADLSSRSEKHALRVDAPDDMIARADPDKLLRVLTNLVENAQKYTDGGEVVVAVRSDGKWVETTVTDQGDGIPAAQQTAVFDKFARRDLAGSPSGTGLGLYIAKGLIEAQGGEMGLVSTEGAGSTFWFRVPRWVER
jgi:signal transduction histidine kinase